MDIFKKSIFLKVTHPYKVIGQVAFAFIICLSKNLKEALDRMMAKARLAVIQLEIQQS